jgi:hypothetical protein
MRNFLFLLVSLMSYLIVLPSYAVEFCNFPYSEPIEGEVAVVGQAVDSDRERFKVLNAFKGNIVEVGGSSGSLSAALVRNYEEILEKTNLKRGGSFGIGPFKFGKSREFIQTITKKKYTATFVLQFDVKLPNEKFEIDTSKGTPLTDYALTLVNNPCQFKQIFGDSFVFQTQRGASVYVAINVSFSSSVHLDEYKQNMDASLEGKFDGLTKTVCTVCGAIPIKIPAFNFKATLEQATGKTSKSTVEDGKIDVVAMQIGGDASRLGQIFGTGQDVALASCSLSALDNCDKAFNNVLAYLAQEEFATGVKNYPTVLSYLSRPYWEVDPSIQLVKEVTPAIQSARDQLAQKLLNRETDLSTLKDMLASPLTVAHRQVLTTLQSQLGQDIQKLTATGFTCFSDLASCESESTQVLGNLTVYDKAVLQFYLEDGLMAHFSFDPPSSSKELITNSYPFAARLYGDINYESPDYYPHPERLFKDKPALDLTDGVSSSTVFPGCTVTLFDGYSYTGNSTTVSNRNDFRDIGWNDVASSAKLNCPSSTETTVDDLKKYKGAVYGAKLVADRANSPNSAYSFDNTFIDIPDNNELIAPYMTVGAWVKPANNNAGIIVGKVSDNWDHQYALWQNGNNLSFSIRRTNGKCQGGGWYRTDASSQLAIGKWSFVVGTWDGNTAKIYVNGELKGSKADIPSGGIDNCQSGSVRVGFWTDQSVSYFKGDIDDLILYSRALSDEEIQRIYTGIKSNTTSPEPTTDNRIKGISTRALVDTAPEKFMIAGIYVQGTDGKKVLVRATGKGLVNQGVNTQLDAKMEIRELSSGGLLDSNDDWRKHGTASEIQAAGHTPQNETDAALFISFNQGYYTMQVMPSGTQAGVGLVEVYDQVLNSDSRLSGISTRSYVGTTPANYMYAGLAIQGTVKVMIRGLGKGLAAQGVTGALDDAKIILRNQAGTVVDSNDNWATHVSAGILQQRGQAPSDSSDAAMIIDLSDGLYTIEVSSAKGGSGVALVEVYEITM